MGQTIMIAALRESFDRFLGRGDAAITVPIFDGALRPNQILEQAQVVATLEGAEDIATDGSALFVAQGATIVRLDADRRETLLQFDSPITALASTPSGGFAVALAGREVRIVGGPHDGRAWTQAGGVPFGAINALTIAAGERILATDGSQVHPWTHWKHDLMSLGRSGRVMALDAADGSATILRGGLEFAFGACEVGGALWISESWRHRILAIDDVGRAAPLLDRLPMYPSRLYPAAGGGAWLTAFAARTQLVEFVLRERPYRERMMKEIDPECWIAPRLSSGIDFLEATQSAHLKTMGVLKPWAPPRSYGLVVRLGVDGAALYSFHSRVDGANHGIVAAAEIGDFLYCLAKGPGRILRMPKGPGVRGGAR
jgi:hypothetical protein